MMYILSILLTLALVCVGVLIWYIRKLVQYLSAIEEDFYAVSTAVTEYNTHLEQVYNSERYYGDATLEGLMNHTQALSQELGVFTESLNDITRESTGPNEEKKEK